MVGSPGDTPWKFKIWIDMDILDTKLNREFVRRCFLLKYGSFICVWYLSCVHKCPSLLRFIPDGLLKIGHLRLQNLVPYPFGRRFEKRWKLISALVIL